MDSHCNICGIFTIGKIIPESNNPGSITDIAEMITALIWFRTKVDISKPNANERKDVEYRYQGERP